MLLRGFGLFYSMGARLFFVFYILELQNLVGPFFFDSKISPSTALSKMDPTWTNVRKYCVVCNQMLAGNN
jgi:hypothetical protein